jgi:hypothetical protein
VEILHGWNDVISAQSFVLSPIWFSWIKNRKNVLDKKTQVRRSTRLKEREMMSHQVGDPRHAGQHVSFDLDRNTISNFNTSVVMVTSTKAQASAEVQML